MKLVIAVFAFVVSGCTYLGPSNPIRKGSDDRQKLSSEEINYATVNKLVIQPKCMTCHPSGHSVLEDIEGLRANKSDVLSVVFVEKSMPPSRATQLTACEKAILKNFLEKGAPAQSSTKVSDLVECQEKPAEPDPGSTSTPAPTPELTPEASPTP